MPFGPLQQKTIKTEVCFSQVWSLESLRSSPGRVGFWGEPAFWLMTCGHLLTAFSCEGRARRLSGFPFRQTLVSFLKAPFSKPSHLSKLHPQYYHPGLGFPHMNFGAHKYSAQCQARLSQCQTVPKS
jgi:hypothetical protein